MELDHHFVEQAVDFYFDEVKQTSREADQLLIKQRNKLLVKIPKDKPLVFRPFGRVLKVNFLHVKRQKYIVPQDLLERTKDTDIARYLRRRYVVNAFYKKENKKSNLEICFVELLPSLLTEVVGEINKQLPRGKSNKINKHNIKNNIVFFSISRSVGEDHRNIKYDVSPIKFTGHNIPDQMINARWEEMIRLYSIPSEEEDFYMMLRDYLHEKSDSKRIASY